MNRRYLDVALALALTPACGIDPNALSGGLSPNAMRSSQHEALAEDTNGVDEEEEEENEGALPGPTVTRVRQLYSVLKTNGSLDEPKWRMNEMPPSSTRYARVDLEDDATNGVYDGYAKSALVPLDRDGVAQQHFYVMREGGVAGWEFLAGPFNLATPAPAASQTVMLGEQNAGQTVEISSGDRLVVDLPCNPASGYIWAASSNLTQAQQQNFNSANSHSWSTTRFMWDTAAATSGKTYSIHLQYKRVGELNAMRDMVIAVSVR